MHKNNGRTDDDFFLPNFCELYPVFAVVVLSELFAIILSLAEVGLGLQTWTHLALTSMFMQWAGLSSAAVLCVLRGPLRQLGNPSAAIISYLLLLLIVGVLSEVGFHFDESVGLGLINSGHNDFVLGNLAIGTIVIALALRYFYVRQQWRRQACAEGEARLQALQARIRPHFLFNSMNTIASLTRSNPELAERSIEDLADLFRASLGNGRNLIPLAEELELTQRYLQMESLRLGERLVVEWGIAAGLERCPIPPLTLQPLVENAVYHGIEPRTDGGTVQINARLNGDELFIEVNNPLPETPRQSQGNRIALDNVRQRLEVHFPGRARLEAGATEAGEYRVELRLPCEEVGG